jgi:hypothetical protein
MGTLSFRFFEVLKAESRSYGFRDWHTVTIVGFPFFIVVLISVFGALASTRASILSILRENGPVELLTFALFFAASIIGVVVVKRLRSGNQSFLLVLVFSLFSLMLFIIAMEEIAWGQWFFHFDSPEFFQQHNRQGETTLHNIGILQGRSEFFRLFAGICAFAAYVLSKNLRSFNLEVPHLLVPYILIITILAGIDLYGDFLPLPSIVDRGTARLSEVVEMLIAAVAFLYLSIMARAPNLVPE